MIAGMRLNPNDLNTLNENKNEIKKKKRILCPNIRFNLKIEKSNDDNLNEYNFNSIVLKALKFKQKLVKDKVNDPEAYKNLQIIDSDFYVDCERLPELITKFEKKISLNKGLNYCDIDENEEDDDEDGDLKNEGNNENNDDENGEEDSESIDDSEDEDDDDDEDESDEDGEDDDDEEDDDDDNDDNESTNSNDQLIGLKSQNFARWAQGYDDNDSFIDNTEALEERLPSNKMPKRGKFYVNKDQKIQLVKAKPKKSDDDDSINNVVPRKVARKLSSSSSGDSIQEIPIKKLKKNEDAPKNEIKADGQMMLQNQQTNNVIRDLTTQIQRNQVKSDASISQVVNKPKNQDVPSNNNNPFATSNLNANKMAISSSSSTSPILLFNNNEQKPSQKTLASTSTNNSDVNESIISPVTYNRIPNILKDLLVKIQDALALQKSYDGIWPNNIKELFLNIYKESFKVEMQDKSEIFRFLAFRLSIKKTSLLKRCRRLLEKEQQQSLNNSSSNIAAPVTATAATSVNTNSVGQLNATPKQNTTPQKQSQQQQNEFNFLEVIKQQQQQYQQQQKEQQQQFVQQQQYINFSIDSLEPDLKEKILYVIQVFNQSSPREFTFEVNNYLNSIDSQARKLYNKDKVNQIYSYLAMNFKLEKEIFIRKLNQIRSEFYEKQLVNSIKKFKFELDKEMKILEEKHNQAYSEFVLKLNEQQFQQQGEPEQKKKIFGPRKKFIWTGELKELYKKVLNNLMTLYESKDNNVDKMNYLREFIATHILNLWPDGWMQMNVLMNESELLLGLKQPANKKPTATASNTQVDANNQQNILQTVKVQNKEEKLAKTSYVENNRSSNSNAAVTQSQTQVRKVVPERVQNVTSSQLFHQQQQPQQQQRNQNNTQQKVQSNIQQQQQQQQPQRAQNVTHNQQQSPQQQQSRSQNVSKQQNLQQTQQSQQSSQKNQNNALNQLNSAYNLTSNQQKLFANSNNSSISMNSIITSILANSNVKNDDNSLDNLMQAQIVKQFQNFYQNSSANNQLQQTIGSLNNFPKNWSSADNQKLGYQSQQYSSNSASNNQNNRNDQN